MGASMRSISPGNAHAPRPGSTSIANPSFGTLISETGAGFTWLGNSQRNRLTQWSNDPVMDPASEAIYLRDEETGITWSPTASPIREETPTAPRHGAGYTIFEHNSHGIEQELTVFVPMDDQGGEPIKLQKLVLRNDSGRPRKLSLTYYVEWTLGEARETSQMHVVTSWDDEVQALLARNHYNPDYADRVAFAAVSAPTVSYTGDRTAFIGRNRSISNPAAMGRMRLSRQTGAGLDPCAAVQATLKLAPGDRAEITCMLGQAQSVEQVHALVLAYRDSRGVETALRQTQAWWDIRLGAIQVHTPELAADILINRLAALSKPELPDLGPLRILPVRRRLWLPRPIAGRDGPAICPSAVGARADPACGQPPVQGRRRPALVASAGRRGHPIADLRRSFMASLVVAQYVRVTGDAGLLREVVPFLDAPLLNADQHESFQSPVVSPQPRHDLRALPAGAGPRPSHGRPWLAPDGDRRLERWNEPGGRRRQGESVWLAWFMVDVMKGMAELAERLTGPSWPSPMRGNARR